MTKIVFSLVFALSLSACAATEPTISKENKWNGSTLSNEVIGEVQAKLTYRQCVYTEAQKKGYMKIDTRVATDAIMKQCEPTLGKIRTIFIDAGVPAITTDRFLKKTRVDLTRSILKSLMFAEATRKASVQ